MFENKVMRSESGDTYYYDAEDRLHREGGPAIEYLNGFKCWYIKGQPHREDGPAMIFPDGAQAWFRNGQLHRGDGPAYECPDGDNEWHLDGEELTEEEFLARMAWTPEEIVLNGVVYRRAE